MEIHIFLWKFLHVLPPRPLKSSNPLCSSLCPVFCDFYTRHSGRSERMRTMLPEFVAVFARSASTLFWILCIQIFGTLSCVYISAVHVFPRPTVFPVFRCQAGRPGSSAEKTDARTLRTTSFRKKEVCDEQRLKILKIPVFAPRARNRDDERWGIYCTNCHRFQPLRSPLARYGRNDEGMRGGAESFSFLFRCKHTHSYTFPLPKTLDSFSEGKNLWRWAVEFF